MVLTAPDPRRERRIGWVCAMLVLGVWVAFQIAGRFSARQSMTPWDVLALRHAGAFLTVLPMVARHGLPRLRPGRAAALVLFSAFGFPLGAYLGFSLAPVALGAVILFGALPVATALFARAWFGERLSRGRIISLPILAVAVVLVGVEAAGHTPAAAAGAGLFLGASCCLAMFTLLLRHWRIRAYDAVVALALYGAPVTLPVWWLFLPSTLHAASLRAMVTQAVVQGAITAVFAMFLYARAVNALGSGPPTLVAALVPGLAALSAWVLLGERLGILGVVGVGLATVGMVIGVFRPTRARP